MFRLLHCMGIKSVQQLYQFRCRNLFHIHQCDAVKGGCSSIVLNITMKKLLLQKVGVHKRRRDHVDHLLLLWIFAE